MENLGYLAQRAALLAAGQTAAFPSAALVVLVVAAAAGIFLFMRKRRAAGRQTEAAAGLPVPEANDFAGIAKRILDGVGGGGNVVSVENCITRLRLEIKDYTLVDERKIKSSGAAGIIRPSKTAVQVIIGTRVQQVAAEFKKLI